MGEIRVGNRLPFRGNSLPKKGEKRVGNRLPFREIRHQRRRRRGLETDYLSREFATKEGGEEGIGNRLPFRGIRLVGIEGGGEEGRKQTAFPENSLPKKEEKRV